MMRIAENRELLSARIDRRSIWRTMAGFPFEEPEREALSLAEREYCFSDA